MSHFVRFLLFFFPLVKQIVEYILWNVWRVVKPRFRMIYSEKLSTEMCYIISFSIQSRQSMRSSVLNCFSVNEQQKKWINYPIVIKRSVCLFDGWVGSIQSSNILPFGLDRLIRWVLLNEVRNVSQYNQSTSFCTPSTNRCESHVLSVSYIKTR